ncbi:MAG: DUF3726 domain-containing protein [Rhizobiales bacterium]|nr:DUF3726 domain-containing protein [Hyphomicrobiales bacterium]
MKTSFDEIRKIAFRALDSAGAPAGIDDDGGWACAWLEAAGYPGLQMLAQFFDDDGGPDAFGGVESIAGGEIAAGGRSAITLAALIVEYASMRTEPVTVRQLAHAPFLIAHAARLAEHGTNLIVDPVREAICDVTIRHAGDGYAKQRTRTHEAISEGLDVDKDAFERVYAYSRRILVPQSETSLLSGAGAGLTDND